MYVINQRLVTISITRERGTLLISLRVSGTVECIVRLVQTIVFYFRLNKIYSLPTFITNKNRCGSSDYSSNNILKTKGD
jgi:hypothetical protein